MAVTPKPFDLESELTRVDRLWSGTADTHLPLSVAAALAFHGVHGGARAIRSREDYDDALNLAAAGLASKVPIYAMADPREGRKPVAVDLLRQSFVHGATRLRSSDGSSLAGLTVLRSDLLSAVAQFRSIGAPALARPGAATSPMDNRLLARLPVEDYARLAPHLELVPLRSQEVVYAERAQLRYVYFPASGVVSLLYITARGAPTEIAVIGNDGAVGVALLLADSATPRRAVVQIAGQVYAIKAEVIREEFRRGGAVQSLLLRYVQSLMNQMSQTAVCNRHHSIEQQLCRWLLLTLDRISSSEILMTQELISQMLGVRRSGITEAARVLQQAGILQCSRGRIRVPDRSRLEARACECYGVVKREMDRLLPPPASATAGGAS